jgi:antitoxin (DNA-binding transcriptional repressor) of toxin-antitoxin stability system
MNPHEYRENRARFPLAELVKYDGQWVAFSRDGRRIIASSDDLATLDRLVVAAGEDPEQVALERIELEDSYLGGAELSHPHPRRRGGDRSMKVIEKTDATGSLADYAAQVSKGPIIITSEGQPVAALVAIENADLETVSLSTNRQFLALIEQSRRRAQTEGGIPSEEMRQRFARGMPKKRGPSR